MIENVDSFLNPRSVAVIGASENPNKVGGRPIHYMNELGFGGRVYPINPARAEIQGHQAFASIEAVAEVPDAVIVAVAGEGAIEQVRLCANRGVKAAVVMSSGFAELGPEGLARQHALVEAARSGGMKLLGPNAQGTANFANGAILNFSTMFAEVPPQDGPIAIISQSGAASVMPYALLRKAGYGVRYVAATGNDADVGACAMAEAVARDAGIKLILIYLESISEPERLASAAAIARRNGAYLVVLKSGGSQRGAAAASSHTGAVVGDDAAVDAFLARHGIWRAQTINEFIRATPLYLQDRPVGEGRTVAMSHSGAVSVMVADLAEREGLPLTELAPETRTRLKEVLPSFATASNPLDMTAAILNQPGLFTDVLGAIGADPAADMVVVGVPVAGPGYDLGGMADQAAGFADRSGKPMVVCAPQDNVRAFFDAKGLATFTTEADGIAALRQYWVHRRLRAGVEITGRDEGRPLGRSGLQDEAGSLALLAEAGVGVVPHHLCADAEAAVQAFERMGGPVVVKGCAAAVPHKSEHRLVHLGLAEAGQVRRAAEDCLATLRDLGIAEPQVLVASMVRGGHEFALGVKVDPVLGPVVLIGEGGTLLELRRDIALLHAPFTEAQAREACRGLRLAPLFDGYRGAKPLDLEALAASAAALGRFAAAHSADVVSVDVNPVIVLPAGSGAVAVDAVVELR